MPSLFVCVASKPAPPAPHRSFRITHDSAQEYASDTASHFHRHRRLHPRRCQSRRDLELPDRHRLLAAMARPDLGLQFIRPGAARHRAALARTRDALARAPDLRRTRSQARMGPAARALARPAPLAHRGKRGRRAGLPRPQPGRRPGPGRRTAARAPAGRGQRLERPIAGALQTQLVAPMGTTPFDSPQAQSPARPCRLGGTVLRTIEAEPHTVPRRESRATRTAECSIDASGAKPGRCCAWPDWLCRVVRARRRTSGLLRRLRRTPAPIRSRAIGALVRVAARALRRHRYRPRQ